MGSIVGLIGGPVGSGETGEIVEAVGPGLLRSAAKCEPFVVGAAAGTASGEEGVWNARYAGWDEFRIGSTLFGGCAWRLDLFNLTN